MYSTNLEKINLDDFLKILKTVQMLPSQKLLLTNIDLNFKKLQDFGVKNLFELQKTLKNKKKLTVISQKLDITTEYLTILNGVVNSYEVKPMPIDKIGIFTENELNILKSKNIKSSKDYYNFFIGKKLAITEIPTEKLNYAICIVDLIRINGVGIEFSKILYEIGIKSVASFKSTDSITILQKFNDFNNQKKITKSKLGINDIQYCKRFSEVLDCDV